MLAAPVNVAGEAGDIGEPVAAGEPELAPAPAPVPTAAPAPEPEPEPGEPAALAPVATGTDAPVPVAKPVEPATPDELEDESARVL